MNRAIPIRQAGALLVPLGAALFGFLLVIALLDSTTKIVAAIIGGAVLLATAYLSGNLRLFSLYGLMFAVPFDLSKRFGPIIEKMGGESSFRIEFSDLFLAVLLLYLAQDLWSGRRQGIRIPRVLWLWVAVMAMGLMAIMTGPWRTTAAHEVVRMIKVSILFVAVCNELDTPNRIFHAVAAFTFSVYFQSAVGLTQFITRKQFGLQFLGETGSGTIKQLAADTIRSEHAFRAGAFLSHPNIFGIFLACLLPMILVGFLLRRGMPAKIYFLGGVLMGMGALIATLSRSGWVSFFLAFCVLMTLLILHHGTRRRSILAVAAASAALLVVCIIFAEPIITRVTESKESAMLSRLEYIHDATGMIRARPLLGWGLNSYAFAAPPFTKYGTHGAWLKYENWLPPVHNIYLLWWAELGIVGLILHLVMIGWILRISIRNFRVPDNLLFAINAACLAGMVAFLVDGMFSFSLRINSILRVFWVISGMIFAIHYWRLRHEASGSEA